MTPSLTDVQFRQRLLEESQRWETENLLSPQQREAILLRYAPPPETPAETTPGGTKEFPLFIRVVLALAVFLIGLAVFLLVSFNWEYLPDDVKLLIVGAVLAAAHCVGLYLRNVGWKYWGDAAFFFAGIMYGVGIWQVGQVFNITANFPVGMWLWAVGVFLMAMVLGSTPLHLLSVGVLVVSGIAGMFHFYFFFPVITAPEFTQLVAWSMPVFALLGIASGILKPNRFALLLYALLLVFWWILLGIACHIDAYLTFHIAAAGLLCLAVSTWQPKGRNRTVLRCIGILLTFGGLIPPSSLWYWNGLLYAQGRYYFGFPWLADPDIAYWLLMFSFFMINLLVMSALFRYGHYKESLYNLIRRNTLLLAWVISFFALWMGSLCLSSVLGPSYYHRSLLNDQAALGGMFAVNVLIVWLAVGLILYGLRRERGGWFWGGVLFFLFWAVVRYVDLFSGAGGMLGASAIFMFCGLFMFGVAYVWTTYRHKFRVQEPASENLQEFTMPVWLAAIRDRIASFWQSERNIFTAVVIVAVIQFGILVAMIVNETRPHVAGMTIRVTTTPADPRDLFRGDYVTLRYKFSNASSIPGSTIRNDEAGQTVFVTMEQDGELWKATGINRTKPKEGVFLRGTLKSYGREIVYGIESYFVQEGTGKAIEEAMRRNRENVVVELVVAPDGKAAIKTVSVNVPEPPVPES